jgi:hypothetical protein
VDPWGSFASRRSPVRSRYAPFADRNPACFAGHDDFDRLHLSIRALAADAGKAGIGVDESESAEGLDASAPSARRHEAIN